MTESEAVTIIAAVSETIRALGEVPSGHLYAHVMDKMSLATYQSILGILKRAGLVAEKNHLLTWIGPKPCPKCGGECGYWNLPLGCGK